MLYLHFSEDSLELYRMMRVMTEPDIDAMVVPQEQVPAQRPKKMKQKKQNRHVQPNFTHEEGNRGFQEHFDSIDENNDAMLPI